MDFKVMKTITDRINVVHQLKMEALERNDINAFNCYSYAESELQLVNESLVQLYESRSLDELKSNPSLFDKFVKEVK